MKWILSVKHWQIFPLIFLSMLLNGFTVVGNLTLTIVLKLTGFMIYFSWLVFVGHALYQLLPKIIRLNYNLFIINAGVSGITYALVLTLYGEETSFQGLSALAGIYFVYAFLHVIMFPVRLLKSIEMDEKASVGDCIGVFLLAALLPVGIWFLQPRINKIAMRGRD